jgi:hypothetical protein
MCFHLEIWEDIFFPTCISFRAPYYFHYLRKITDLEKFCYVDQFAQTLPFTPCVFVGCILTNVQRCYWFEMYCCVEVVFSNFGKEHYKFSISLHLDNCGYGMPRGQISCGWCTKHRYQPFGTPPPWPLFAPFFLLKGIQIWCYVG